MMMMVVMVLVACRRTGFPCPTHCVRPTSCTSTCTNKSMFSVCSIMTPSLKKKKLLMKVQILQNEVNKNGTWAKRRGWTVRNLIPALRRSAGRFTPFFFPRYGSTCRRRDPANWSTSPCRGYLTSKLGLENVNFLHAGYTEFETKNYLLFLIYCTY